MAKKVARLLLTLAGAAAGVGLVALVNSVVTFPEGLTLYQRMLPWGLALVFVGSGIIIAIIFNLLFAEPLAAAISHVETGMSAMPAGQLLYCACGLTAGLVIAYLASTLAARFKPAWVVLVIDVILYISFGYLGWSVMSRKKGQLPIPAAGGHGKTRSPARPKLLDTSVIIDGRIADICDTGVIEGEIIVPSFVLRELQHIADSSDSLKRNRGRRGLDILKEMQDKKSVPITVVSTDYKDVDEVDAKLILLASELGGVVVTNDYNLNKVAAVRKVPVLNINELANALKPIAMPGEEMSVFVVKEGKEAGQGIGYMDDGTMIVIENGRRLVGETVDVTVTSVLQTSAGRMIFARVKQA